MQILEEQPNILSAQTIDSPDPRVEVYHVMYRSAGLRVMGYLAYRRASADVMTRRPGFVYCRGGIGRVGMVKLDWVVRFALREFIVFAPSYRGNEGGEGREDFGLADREDVFSAITLLRSLPFVDPEHITVYGFSRGGPMALFSGMESLGLRVAITHGGVSDLALTYEQRVDLRRMLRRVVGGTPSKFPDAYAARSPIWRVKDLQVPVLVIHGTDDVQVDVSHADALCRAMHAASITHEAWILPGVGHHLENEAFNSLIDDMRDYIRISGD
jgi:dipeptidyl aminopeptidase/acylaminoacyl peptidase